MQTKVDAQQAPALDTEPLVKANGASGDVDELEYEDDEDEDEDEDAEKSLPSESDLLKAMDALDTFSRAADSGVPVRQAALAAKLANGEPLSKSEADEMHAYLESEDEALTKSHREEFAEDPTIDQGMDAVPFLDSLTTQLCKSLDDLRDDLHVARADAEEFNGVLAKSVSALGSTVVAQAQRIEALENLVKSLAGIADQPQARKGTTRVGQKFGEGEAMAKSEAASTPANLSRPVILDTMDDLIKSARESTGKASVDGLDLVHEQVKFESTGILNPKVLALVAKERGIQLPQ